MGSTDRHVDYLIASKHFRSQSFLLLSYSIFTVSVSFSHPITPSTTESSFEITSSTPPLLSMSTWHSHASPRSQMSLDYEEDENEAFLPPRRVFSFDEWNEPPNTEATPQVFSFDEWTDPGDDEDSNHDDEDQDLHSYTTPPAQASMFKQVTERVSTYKTSATRQVTILKDLLVPLETTPQSECAGGDSDKTTRHHCQGIPRFSSLAAHNSDEKLATILVDIQGFWPLGITIEFENKDKNIRSMEDEDDDDVSTMAESLVVEEMPPTTRQQEQLLFDDQSLPRPRRLAFGRHRRVQQRLVQLVPWNCWTGSSKLQVGSNRPCGI